MFLVGEATIYRWLKNNGGRNGKPGPKEGRKVTQAALKEALSTRPDAKLTELGRAFGVDPTTICHACKKWKITRKKNVGLRRAGR
jgi:transposase